MTSFDYAYKLEAVHDWLFAQTKLSVPLLALLLSFFGLIFVFLIYPENAPPIKSGALYQNTVPLPKRRGCSKIARKEQEVETTQKGSLGFLFVVK